MPKATSMQDPDPSFQPTPAVAETLRPGLRRVLASNPSPMTFRGTNTYLLGTRDLAVIDPGPNDPAHLEAIQRSIGPNQTVTHILVTHAHLDHSPLASFLAEATGAPVMAFGDAQAGRSAVMRQLLDQGFVSGGEGVDAGFIPDICVPHGTDISGSDWALTALHTPGHFGNHLCFSWGNCLFSGDLVMGWASSLVSPPDGDLTDFMASCQSLSARPWDCFYPGHGAPVDAPAARLRWLIAHRKAREDAILVALDTHPDTARGLTERIYTNIPKALAPAAERNVLAHLIDLQVKFQVTTNGELGPYSRFQRV